MLISWNKYCNATVGLFIEEFSDTQLESFGFLVSIVEHGKKDSSASVGN